MKKKFPGSPPSSEPFRTAKLLEADQYRLGSGYTSTKCVFERKVIHIHAPIVRKTLNMPYKSIY